jgi:hypothetical protein
MKISVTQKAALASYFRSVLATVLATVLAGVSSPKDIGAALLAAALPPIIRWANPSDPAFGRTK